MDLRLLVLCFGNFIIGTGTLIVPGMLPALARGLGVNVPVAAQLITAFAFTGNFSQVPKFWRPSKTFLVCMTRLRM